MEASLTRRPIIGEERERWKAECGSRYNNGDSTRKIARETGRSYGWVYRILQEAGVTMRPRGGPGKRRR